MMRTTAVKARIEPKLKQTKLTEEIPFDSHIPSKVTQKTFEDTDKGKNLVRHKNSKAMFDKLGM